MVNVLGGVLILALCIGLHEGGHLLAALAFGLRVRRFAIGVGPVVVALRSVGGEWRIAIPFGKSFRLGLSARPARSYELRAIPLGGFIDCPAIARLRIPRDPSESKLLAAVHEGRSASTVARIVVAAAGPLANFLTATACFAVLILDQGGRAKDLIYAPVEVFWFLSDVFHALRLKNLSGPIGLMTELSKVSGAMQVVSAIGALSAQWFVFNLLPLPPLDGSRIVVALYERARHRRLVPREKLVVGLTALVFLVVSLVGMVALDVAKLAAHQG